MLDSLIPFADAVEAQFKKAQDYIMQLDLMRIKTLDVSFHSFLNDVNRLLHSQNTLVLVLSYINVSSNLKKLYKFKCTDILFYFSGD